MGQKSIEGWGGKRPGSGQPVAVPAGEGEKTRVTVALGEELMVLLRGQFPGLTDPDVLRAACWAAVGQPKA